MSNKYVSICPICQSLKIEKIFVASDYLITNESFEILECQACTLRFTSPIPSEENIIKYYQSEEYAPHSDGRKSIISKFYRLVQFFTLKSKCKKVEKYSQKISGSLLDIGSGTGKFLHVMQKAGWDIYGVEINDTARTTAEAFVGKPIYSQKGFFNSDKIYDVITMWHSLEHLHELKQYVQKISTTLNANGVIMIAVPNYLSVDAEYYHKNWAAYDVPRHLYHFSFEAISKLFNENGFILKDFQQLPFDSFYVSLLSELSMKGKNNYIKALIIGLKSYWKGRINAKQGSSILYVFKRSDA